MGYDDAFRLPCHLHDRGWCTIYDDTARPHVCGAFQCVLLKRLVAGEVDLDRSLEAARIGRDLADQVKGRVGSATAEPGWLWAQVADVWRVEGNNVIESGFGAASERSASSSAPRPPRTSPGQFPRRRPKWPAATGQPSPRSSKARPFGDDGRGARQRRPGWVWAHPFPIRCGWRCRSPCRVVDGRRGAGWEFPLHPGTSRRTVSVTRPSR